MVEGQFKTPAGHPVTFAYREGTNDWNTLNASLNEDEYSLPRDLSGVALDIGGYLGSVGIALALDNPALRVVIIEPVPDNIILIGRNLELNGLTGRFNARVHLIGGAVGRDGEEVRVRYGFQGSESVEHHAFVGNSTLAGDATYQETSYPAIGLRRLVNDWGPIAYMKLDTEGAEWAFLNGPGLAYVQTIVGEAHAVDGHRGLDIVALLEPTHHVTTYGDTDGTCEFRAVLR